MEPRIYYIFWIRGATNEEEKEGERRDKGGKRRGKKEIEKEERKNSLTYLSVVEKERIHFEI